MDLLSHADALFGILDGPTVQALTDYLVAELAPGGRPNRALPAAEAPWDPFTRLRLTRRHYAYVRIAEGCANRCRYCVIPDIRGPLRSRPAEEVVAEARHLVADGAVELCLVAEDTTSYGRDRGEPGALAALLRELAEVEALRWIRLLYTHPAHFTDELVETLASFPKVCHYIDLPIQHADDGILAAMGRGVTQEGIRQLIARLRSALPGLFLRTSIIVGFPGEGEGEFARLLDFLREERFERLGVFAYSPEPGTPAYELPGQVPEEERERRRDEVMSLQQEIAFSFNSGLLGQRLAAIVDDVPGGGSSYWLGRTYGDAPEVDGVLYLSGPELAPGQLWEARIVGTQGYDLVGLAERRM
jgi:ribosomal protein S12 methylthiotransferase